MSSTRREDIIDYVWARQRGFYILADAYARLLVKKIGRKESEATP